MSKGRLHTVVETPEFRRAAKASGLAAEELQRILDHLARKPDAGDVIPGTGGARKVRFRGRGHGEPAYLTESRSEGPEMPVRTRRAPVWARRRT